MALDLEDIGITVDDEDRILALTTGLDKTYDSFVISLDSTATADLTFDHVVNRLLNEDVRRGSTEEIVQKIENVALVSVGYQGRGRGQGVNTCYRCGKEGHIQAFCTETPLRGKGVQERATAAVEVEKNYAF